MARRKEIELHASVQMQKVFRGHVARKWRRDASQREAAAIAVQRHVRGGRERAKYNAYRKEKRERLASTRIQARFRGNQARVHALELRILAIMRADMELKAVTMLQKVRGPRKVTQPNWRGSHPICLSDCSATGCVRHERISSGCSTRSA